MCQHLSPELINNVCGCAHTHAHAHEHAYAHSANLSVQDFTLYTQSLIWNVTLNNCDTEISRRLFHTF